MNPAKKKLKYREEGRSQFSMNAVYVHGKKCQTLEKRNPDLIMFWMSNYVHGKQTDLLTWSGRQAGDQTSKSTDSASLVNCKDKNELLMVFSW